MTPGAQPTADKLPFGRGRFWLEQALQLIRSELFRLVLLCLILQLVTLMFQAGVLFLLFWLMVPVFTAGMLQAMHLARQGVRPPYLTVFAAFSQGPRLVPLLLLGAIMLGLIFVSMIVAISSILPQLNPEVLERMQMGDPEAVLDMDPAFLQRVLLALAFGFLAGAAISYFAVPLIWFNQRGLGSAMWEGLRVLGRQWRPLVVLGLLLALIALPVMLLNSMAMSAVMLGGERMILVELLAGMASLAYQLVMFSTLYVAFSDIYSLTGQPERPESTPDDQLVA